MRFLSMTILACFMACTPPPKDMETAVATAEPVYPWDNCKNELQSHACNFSGNTISGFAELYDYYQKPIVLDFSTMWCNYCQVAGAEAQALQDQYAEHDLIYITILIENFSGEPPTQQDIQSWKDNFGVGSAPVWGASRDIIGEDPAIGWSVTGWPTFYFIDKNMKVQGLLRGYSRQMIIDGIDYAVSIKGEQ